MCVFALKNQKKRNEIRGAIYQKEKSGVYIQLPITAAREKPAHTFPANFEAGGLEYCYDY